MRGRLAAGLSVRAHGRDTESQICVPSLTGRPVRVVGGGPAAPWNDGCGVAVGVVVARGCHGCTCCGVHWFGIICQMLLGVIWLV